MSIDCRSILGLRAIALMIPGEIFLSGVSCTFSSCIFQSKNSISWYALFFVCALQFEGLFIPMRSMRGEFGI